MTLPKEDLAELRRAKALLENPGLAAKLSSVLGTPFEKGMKMLPAKVQKTVHTATEAALMKALDVDEDLAGILVQSGFSSIDEIAYVPQSELAAI
jgi:hypothetical protein